MAAWTPYRIREVLADMALGELLTGWRLVTSLPAIVLVAFAAGRLLGVKRPWTVTALSGLAGWVAGTALAVAIGRSENGAGFTRNLWLFSTFFAMSGTVWLELLARPGALARAQTGLASVPRPIRSLRRRSQRVNRYVQITRIVVRNGFGPSLGLAGPTEESELADRRAPMPARLRRTLEECGGMFVKLGQVLSTRSDLLPDGVVAELSRLQDHVPPADPAEVRALLEEDMGAAVDQVFAEFDWEPVAAASIAQAHRARLRSGEAVIVKVQRPGIAAAVERDMQVLLELARATEARTTWASHYRVMDLAEEFADRLREELDFRGEARNATEIAARLPAGSGVRIPKVHGELTTARVLVMEWLDGVSVGKLAGGAGRDDLDRKELADRLLRVALTQMLVDGHFHADPHPGNVMVLGDGTVGLIDFGATGRLDPMQQSSLRAMMVAVARGDAALMRQAVLEVATLRRGFDDDQLERSLARFMARNLGAGSAPSAAMFNELLQLFFSFGIALPPEFSTFFRAIVTLEGTLTTLCPGYLVIAEAQAVASEWMRDRVTPASLEELARAELLSLAPMLRRVPRHLDRLATLVERGDLRARVSLLGDAEDVRVLTTWVNRAVLAFLGGVTGIISVALLAIRGGPAFSGTTSLYQFFGYFGLFCSSVLVLRVLVAILHDGVN
jgi:ubiquinone biosynthesis protein